MAAPLSNVPDYRLAVAGKDLTPVLSGFWPGNPPRRPRLIGLTLSEKSEEAADQLDLSLDDSDGMLSIPSIGATLTLQLGWKQGVGVRVGLVDKGSFVIDSIEHGGTPDILTIRARSADFTGSLTTRREQSWHDSTLGAIVAEVAQRHGLIARCAPAIADVAVAVAAQSRESDLALVRRLGREHDAVATIKHGTLILSPIGSATTAAGSPIGHVIVRRSAGDRHSFTIEKRDEATGVEASWHDLDGAEKRTVSTGGDGRRKKLARVYGSEAAARLAAEAEQSRLGRLPTKLCFNLALGRAEIIPATRVTVEGFKPVIDAVLWLVSGSTHSLTAEGLTTALEMEAA